MNYGPLVFLAAFFALASSWCGFVLTPQLQIGRLQQTNTVGSAASTYPVARPGLAQQGLEVYRANGCACCHSQQLGQTGTLLEIALTDAGTNQAATIAAILKLKCETVPAATGEIASIHTQSNLLTATRTRAEADAKRLLAHLPQPICQSVSRRQADTAVKILNATGAKAELWIVPTGPDLARGWGKRRTVAEDYLFDSTVMPGSQRVGPDLADLGARRPDVNWHLRHLYAPRLEVKGSTMPPYRFLFERRKVGHLPSPEALALPDNLAPGAGYEIVPGPAAKALVAYLTDLRIDAPLFVAPMTLPAAGGTTAPTNAPAAPGLGSTRAVVTNAPAK